MSLVYNPILNEYVAQAPHRMNRLEGVTECPFCSDIAQGKAPEGESAWFRPNDFPSLQPPVGECLIVIYSRNHNRIFTQLSLRETTEIVKCWQEIYKDLSARYECVMIFENSGAEIGQTQWHPHGQVYGISKLPPTMVHEMQSVESAGKGNCPFCKVLEQHLQNGLMVAETGSFVAFIPEYARYPYEVHIYARNHHCDMIELDKDGSQWLNELASLLQGVIRAYHRLWDSPMPYMLALHQLNDQKFHFHIELLPTKRSANKLKFPASSEAAWGLWINDSKPSEKWAELQPLVIEALAGL